MSIEALLAMIEELGASISTLEKALLLAQT